MAVYAATALAGALVAATLAQGPALAAGSSPVTVTVSAQKVIANGGTAHVTGALGVALTQAETVSVTRTTRAGSTQLADVPVATDGTFAFDDQPGTTGTVTYAVSYAGDDTYAAGTGSSKSYEKPLAFDFNGDGYADAAAGSDGEDLGSATNAGAEYTFPGSAAGIKTSGSKAYDQGASGLAGTAEKNDYFGEMETSGDFNGDGFADLAVAAPGETISGNVDAGDVTVIFGSAAGLTTTGSVVEYGSKAKYADFGTGLAAGDFDGNGTDELAVGSTGNDSVYIYSGLSPAHAGTSVKFTQGSGGVPGAAQSGNYITQFGWNLSTGDVNADGYADLAVGAPWDFDNSKGISSGSVVVLDGSSHGLSTSGAGYYTLDTSGVSGSPSTFSTDQPDDFGWQARLADVNGDGHDDLIVGSPGTPVTNSGGKHEDAGAVYVLYSRSGAISGTSSVKLTQDSAGITGSPGKGDQWGSTLVAGDLNADGKADVVATGTDHYVDYLPGSTSGLVTTSSKSFTEDSSGIYGTAVSTDYWGESLQILQIKGAGPAALLVGAPGKHSGKGSLTVMYSTSSGPTGTGSVYIDQDSTSVPGTAETGDYMGTFFQ